MVEKETREEQISQEKTYQGQTNREAEVIAYRRTRTGSGDLTGLSHYIFVEENES